MDWTNLIQLIIAALGGNIIGSFINLRKVKPEVQGISIANEGKALDNLQKVIDEMRKSSTEYRAMVDEQIKELNMHVVELELNDRLKSKAITQWIKCKFAKEAKECPVSLFMDEAEKEIEKKTQELHNSINVNS